MKSDTLDVSTKIRLLITLINDEGRTKLPTEMDKLASRLTDYYPNNKLAIKQSLSKAIALIPLKGAIYAHLLSQLSLPELTGEVIALIIQALKETESPFIVFRVLIFSLQGVNADLFPMSALINFIKSLFDSNKSNFIQMLKYSFAYAIENDAQCYKKLMPAIELFNSLYKKSNDNQWKVIYEAYANGKDSNKVFGLNLIELTTHSNGNTKNKENSSSNAVSPLEGLLPLPLINCDLCQLPFDYFNNSQEPIPIEKTQQVAIIMDIITGMKDNIDRSVNYLLRLFAFFNSEDSDQQKTAYYQSISEVIVNLSLNPRSIKRDITVYGALINELIHRSSSFESKFLSTISQLPKIIPSLSPLSISNFVYFLSFFLNNNPTHSNQLLCVKSDIANDYRAHFFTKMLTEKSSCLLSVEKFTSLVQELPKQYDPFLSELTDQPKVSINQAQNAIYAELSENFKVKKPYEEWKDKLSIGNMHENELLHVFTTCLLCTRSKTLSHLREAIYFYKDTIRLMASTEEKEFILLKGLFDTWEHSSIHLLFTIELLFNNHILSHMTAIKYIFSEKLNQSRDNVLNWLLYELIETTIANCEILLGKTKNELNEQQQSLAKSDEDSRQDIIQKIELLEGIELKLKMENEKIAGETLGRYYQLIDVCGKLGGSGLQEFILGNVEDFVAIHYKSIGVYAKEKEKVEKLRASFK